MVKVHVTNITKIHFCLTSATVSELACKRPFWEAKVHELQPNFEGCIGKLEIPEKFNIDCEAFLSIYLMPKLGLEGDPLLLREGDHPQSLPGGKKEEEDTLILRVKIRKDVTQSRISFSIASIPTPHLSPPTSWLHGKIKGEFVWYLHGQSYQLVISKGAFPNIHLEINDGIGLSKKIYNESSIFQTVASSSHIGYDEVFENEHKDHILGHTKYSKKALKIWDRPAWSSADGRRLSKPEMIYLPGPIWVWKSEWQVEKREGFTDKDGWCYASSWNGEWEAEKSFSKLVRRRRWIRYRELITSPPIGGDNDDGAFSSRKVQSKVSLVTISQDEDKDERVKLLNTRPDIDAELISQIIDNPPEFCTLKLFLEFESRLSFLSFKLLLFEVKRHFYQLIFRL